LAQLDKDKEKAVKKFEKTGRGRRQDHGTRTLTHGRDDCDVEEWLVSAKKRRDARHGADEPLEVFEEGVEVEG